MKIGLLGTCRLASIRRHYSCANFDDAISFVHSTKEVLQLLRFITRKMEIPDMINRFCFRTSILNRQPVVYSDNYMKQFDETDLFVIEISSMTKYLFQGYYLHHLAVDKLFPFYEKSPQDVLLGTMQEYQERSEIEKDIDDILDLVSPRKVLLVSHINATLDTVEPYSRFSGLNAVANGIHRLLISTGLRKGETSFPSPIEKRIKLIEILRSIARDREIPFFEPTVIFKRYRQKKILQREPPGLPPSHYTDFGNKVMGRLYAEQITRITGF